MPAQLYNNVTDQLAAALGSADTEIAVVDGSKFTSPAVGDYFPLYIIASNGAHEIVHVTAVSGNTLTVLRAQEGTDPLIFAGNEVVQIRPTRQSLRELEQVVTTSTGSQTVAGALDGRVNKGEAGAETITTETTPVSINDRFSEYVTPRDFGGLPGLANDASSALESALLSGKPVYLGGPENEWRITRAITGTLTSPLVIRSDGARIVLDTAASIRRAIYINMDTHFVYCEGKLELDCQDNAFSGWYFENQNGAATPAFKSSGFVVKNCFRADQTFTGGDAILVRGRLGKVTIHDVEVDSVIGAIGSQVPGSQGVAGITVTRISEGLDADFVHIYDFNVRNVYNLDTSETTDHDGIRVFQDYALPSNAMRDAYAYVHHGAFYNCNGRAVKIQSERGSVHDVSISRDNSVFTGFLGRVDIDFQVGGGDARNIKCYYNRHRPETVVNFTIDRSTTQRILRPMTVDGLEIFQEGTGPTIENIINIRQGVTPPEVNTENMLLNISGVMIGTLQTTNYFVRINSALGGRMVANVSGCFVRPVSPYVRQTGANNNMELYLSIGACGAGGSVPAWSQDTAGTIEYTSYGTNFRITTPV